MGFDGGVRRRSKRSRSKLARTGVVVLAVAAAEGVLVGALDLTGPPMLATRSAVEAPIPYDLTTERPLRPAAKAHVGKRRLLETRRPETSPAASPLPPSEPNATSPAPTAPPSAAAGPPSPDYGRWTVAPGAWPDTGHGRIVMSVCDPANLASLPEDARKACVERLKTTAEAAGPPSRRGAAQDWKDHGPLSCEPKNEPAHKLLLDHCRGLGLGLKYKF